MCQLLQSISFPTKNMNFRLYVKFKGFAKIFHNFCKNFVKFMQSFAKINDFIFAKFKIVSLKFRFSRNFENAVSQPPYL